ncbi:MAG: hypothetical protein KGH60_04110 [Candidatus Micrarchaeota archaeon]|nr:hypothetical protein [Candidatus Micrarchaeota archaeon]
MTKTVAKKKDNKMEALLKDPSEENWSLFAAQAKKDKAKYYYIYYPSGLKTKNDLSNAYAVIYDAKSKPLYKVPIIKRVKSGIEGATFYFKGLEINRKMM